MTATCPRLLLSGATGLLGAAIVEEWAARWTIVAAGRERRVLREGVENVRAELEAPATLRAVVEAARPDVVLHCAAWTDLDACEANPERARVLHRDASAAIAEGAARVGAKMVYISTDSLFSGPGVHGEADPVDPRSVYARTKYEGELCVLERCPASFIVRTCIVGWNAQRKLSLAEWLLQELRAGKSVKAFADVAFTPVLTTTLAHAIERLVTMGAPGLWHVGGPECVSKLDFARTLARVFALPEELIIPSRIVDVPLFAPRPPSPCLDSSRFFTLTGEPLPSVEAELVEMRRLETSGWLERVRASVGA